MSDRCYLPRIDDGLGDAMSAQAQLAYESNIIKECRHWVANDGNGQISLEHVRILLSWLDAVTVDNQPCETEAVF